MKRVLPVALSCFFAVMTPLSVSAQKDASIPAEEAQKVKPKSVGPRLKQVKAAHMKAKPDANKATTAKKEDLPALKENQTTLTLNADGTVILNAKPVSCDELAKKLTALSRIDPDYTIIVIADKNLPFKDVVRVLNLCRSSNIWNISVAKAEPE